MADKARAGSGRAAGARIEEAWPSHCQHCFCSSWPRLGSHSEDRWVSWSPGGPSMQGSVRPCLLSAGRFPFFSGATTTNLSASSAVDSGITGHRATVPVTERSVEPSARLAQVRRRPTSTRCLVEADCASSGRGWVLPRTGWASHSWTRAGWGCAALCSAHSTRDRNTELPRKQSSRDFPELSWGTQEGSQNPHGGQRAAEAKLRLSRALGTPPPPPPQAREAAAFQ